MSLFTYWNSTHTTQYAETDLPAPTSSWQYFYLAYNAGVAGAGPPDPISLCAVAEDPLNPGTYLYSGHPALDAQEIQVQITDSYNPQSDPDFAPALSPITRLGTGATGGPAVLMLPTFKGDCWVKIGYRILLAVGPIGAQASFNVRLRVLEGTVPPAALPLISGEGIITGVGDASVNEWIDRVVMTASSPADALLNIPARSAVIAGVERYWAAETQTCNQTAADGALGVGQEYKLIATQGVSSVTITKGNKATAGASVLPARPAGELYLGYVVVDYQGGGTSAIETSDIFNVSVAGRFAVRAGTGLQAIVGAGRMIGARQYSTSDIEQSIVLGASVTRYLYRAANGDLSLETTETRPSAGAKELASITTDGSGVTALGEKREEWWEPGAKHLILKGQSGDETVTADLDRTVIERASCLVRGKLAARVTAAGGATGTTDVNYVRNRAGATATIATASLAVGSYTAVLTITDPVLQPGDIIQKDMSAISAGGSRAAGFVTDLTVVPAPV